MQKHTLIGLVTVGMLQAGLAYSAGGEPGDDSVHAWGRWEQMIAPAAGPEVAITPVAIVAPEGNLDLRPEEGQAFGRQVVPSPTDVPSDPTPPDTGVPIVVPGNDDRPTGNPRDQFTPVVVPGAEARPGGNPRDQFPL